MIRLVQGLPHPDSPAEGRIYEYKHLMPGFLFNWPIPDVGYVDLLHEKAMLVIEIDGLAWHDANHERAAKDRKRDRMLADMGYMVRRYTAMETMADPLVVIKDILRAASDRYFDLEVRCSHCDEIPGDDWSEVPDVCNTCWFNWEDAVGCDLECGTIASYAFAENNGSHYGPGQWTDSVETQPHAMWVCPHCDEKMGMDTWNKPWVMPEEMNR